MAGAEKVYRGRFLFFGTGYYNYDEPYTPDFPGIEQFGGEVVHPQFWPESLDYAGKRVVVIGSGATAISLIPALAKTAAQVTMLQRSPTYMMSQARIDPMVQFIRRVLPRKLSNSVVRLRNSAFQVATYFMFRKAPKFGRWLIRNRTIAALPEGYDVDLHFKPKYNPWDQRMCLVLDGDIFEHISDGRAEVVTDHIDHVDATGIVLSLEIGSTRTSSSPPPACSCRRWAASRSPWTAPKSSPPSDSSTRNSSSRTCRTWRGASATPMHRGRCGPT